MTVPLYTDANERTVVEIAWLDGRPAFSGTVVIHGQGYLLHIVENLDVQDRAFRQTRVPELNTRHAKRYSEMGPEFAELALCGDTWTHPDTQYGQGSNYNGGFTPCYVCVDVSNTIASVVDSGWCQHGLLTQWCQACKQTKRNAEKKVQAKVQKERGKVLAALAASDVNDYATHQRLALVAAKMRFNRREIAEALQCTTDHIGVLLKNERKGKVTASRAGRPSRVAA